MLLTPITTLSSLKSLLDSIPIRWVLIGALAANRYRGTPRMTGDVDLLLANTGGSLKPLEAKLTNAGWDVSRADPNGELIRINHEQFGAADLLLAGTAYQQLAIERSIPEKIDSQEIYVLAPEDIILHKLIAGRFQDLADIEAILATSIVLDEDYLRQWVKFWEVEDVWKKFSDAG